MGRPSSFEPDAERGVISSESSGVESSGVESSRVESSHEFKNGPRRSPFLRFLFLCKLWHTSSCWLRLMMLNSHNVAPGTFILRIGHDKGSYVYCT